MQKPLWEFVLFICFVTARMASCLMIYIYLAVMNLGLFGIFIMNSTLFKNMMSLNSVMSMYIYFISGSIATLVAAATGGDLLVVLPLGIIIRFQRYIQLS